MSKKIILAGGAGYLGKNLTLYLIQQGYEVVVLSRTPMRSRGENHPAKRVRFASEPAPNRGEQSLKGDTRGATKSVEPGKGAHAGERS